MAITIIVCTAGAALGPIVTILVGAAKGLLIGAITGGLIGGLSSVASGGSFLDGFEDGAFSGALTGALFGGLGGLGELLGSSCKALNFLGGAVKVIPTISKVSSVISLGMAGFDLLSLGAGLMFGQDNFLTAFNQELHSSKLYNAFQFGVSALAVFSGGFTKGMKNPTCFVAGTLILRASGLVAIENIKAGDKVISTDPETFETAEKTVLKTYIREVTQLVHLTISGELISATMDHPFYVKGHEFVNAGELYIGDKLLDSNGNTLIVKDRKVETLDEAVKVYNFQVEDFHTYHVGNSGTLVHNAGIDYESGKTTKPNQVHHYATNKSKTYTAQLEEILKKYGLDLDEAWNKDLLPHQERHPNAYHEYVFDSMKQFDDIALGDKDIFLKLFDNLKNNVKSNPDMLYKDYWK